MKFMLTEHTCSEKKNLFQDSPCMGLIFCPNTSWIRLDCLEVLQYSTKHFCFSRIQILWHIRLALSAYSHRVYLIWALQRLPVRFYPNRTQTFNWKKFSHVVIPRMLFVSSLHPHLLIDTEKISIVETSIKECSFIYDSI